MKQPFILEIKSNSLDDGPGIRSVIFVKGCPLSCLWCHNPESKTMAAEISFSARDCIGCGTCLKICKHKALNKENKHYVNRKKCCLCFECVEVCPAKALTRIGKKMTVEEIVNKILRDKTFYDVSGGGVTLSGGEITMFPEFSGDLLKQLKNHGIHTLIETCGHFKFDRFTKNMLPFIDIIYFDIKIFDYDLHKKYCGRGNKTILKNFTKLNALSKDGLFTIIPRIPLIPGITDTEENLAAIAEFLKNLNIKTVQLLPYNPTWTEKNEKLGIENSADLFKEQKWQSKEKLSACMSIFLELGIGVK